MHLGMTKCHIPFLGHSTSDLVFRIIVFGAYLILFEIGIPNFGVRMHLRMVECGVLFTGHCDHKHDI